jgi:bifunctional non-homologous end joining protein LigD
MARKSSTVATPPAAAPVQFTHVNKIMFPKPGFTKGDLLQYYAKIADVLIPHLKDRPVTLERLPDGVKDGAPRFWQKNTPEYYPKWIKRITLANEVGKDVAYALVNDLQTLLYLVNQGAVTFHVYFSRTANLERPDFVVFDLDPSGAAFKDVVTIAKAVRAMLEDRGAEAYLKTSGKSGLHICTPWKKSGGYDEARAWATEMATGVVKVLPKIATVERSKSGRAGRVYVDVMQNAMGKHVVPPYTVRGTDGGTVSTPLEWTELTGKLDPKKFNLKTMLARVKKKQDLWAGLSAFSRKR